MLIPAMLKEILPDMASLVYPQVCTGCGGSLYRHEELICNTCYVSLPKTNFHLQKESTISKLFYGRADIEFAGSFLFFYKKGMVQKMLHALKYKGKPEVAEWLGKWYALDLLKDKSLPSVDFIIPVPLHKRRQQKRGYNQSEEFARGLSSVLGIPVYMNIVLKHVYTETQTHKSRAERMENIATSFIVQNQADITGKHVLLVDDVITTGATLEACANKMKSEAQVKVSVLTIAYTQNK